ncbi:MAG: hypothetical protein CO113_16680 [Elusimicrobia bacterium CG_4_9_14_3_um_filter_62_55]|nr:MAG: hypothetical protein COR54_13475 [Elusimicrobia bacterium CG22_combo_CG10-13_8_21_14_all_63_91]PJA14990.1 MAG: hypothetical protein COX66_11190 [Elusimicrobia bacterium CG_4_10_14_0_2_um_filter_63_34]PJB23750.1 MAG: hypothetical protein CO113_16680 [Elusimicrobia bacterium CG_4_9_14_3_um_filter_62_55]
MVQESGTIGGCENTDACGTPIASPASVLSRPLSASLVTRERGSSASSGGEKTACGACGRVHRSWYDRKTRRVRDLPSGEMRIYLDVEVRRVACKGAAR